MPRLPLATSALAFAGFALAFASSASAHEFLLAPVEGGQVRAESTHVFIEPEKMSNLDEVSVSLVGENGREKLPLSEGERGMGLVADLPDGTEDGMVTARRHLQFWSKTADGWKRGDGGRWPEAESVETYEKFAKTPVDPAEVPGEPVGQPLEIVIPGGAESLSAGETATVQVLDDGQPVPARVAAALAGATREPLGYAAVAQPREDENGEPVAEVPISAPGVWVLRVQHTTSGGDGVDWRVRRATYTFEVEE